MSKISTRSRRGRPMTATTPLAKHLRRAGITRAELAKLDGNAARKGAK